MFTSFVFNTSCCYMKLYQNPFELGLEIYTGMVDDSKQSWPILRQRPITHDP